MDAEDFKTLGECEYGTIWEVQSENKIVVNAYQAALYFSRDDFFQFARMVEDAIIGLTGKGFQPANKPQPSAEPAKQAPPPKAKEVSPEAPQITDIRAFRRTRHTDDENDDDFTG